MIKISITLDKIETNPTTETIISNEEKKTSDSTPEVTTNNKPYKIDWILIEKDFNMIELKSYTLEGLTEQDKKRDEFLKGFVEQKKVELKLNCKTIVFGNNDNKEEALVLIQTQNASSSGGKTMEKYLLQHFIPATWFGSSSLSTLCSIYQMSYVDCENIVNEIRNTLNSSFTSKNITLETVENSEDVYENSTLENSHPYEELPELENYIPQIHKSDGSEGTPIISSQDDEINSDNENNQDSYNESDQDNEDNEDNDIVTNEAYEIKIVFAKESLDVSDQVFTTFLFGILKSILGLTHAPSVERFENLIGSHDFNIKTLTDYVNKGLSTKPEPMEIRQNCQTLIDTLKENDKDEYLQLIKQLEKIVQAETCTDCAFFNDGKQENNSIVEKPLVVEEIKVKKTPRDIIIEEHINKELELREKKEKRKLLVMLRDCGFTKYNLDTPLSEMKKVVETEIKPIAAKRSDFLKSLNEALKNRKAD